MTAPPVARRDAPNLPLRPELVGEHPYGAPQLDVPVRLNVNENPYPLPDAVVAAIADAVRAAAVGLNRYPDRDALALRADLAEYLNADTPAGLRTENIWVGNGSNEVLTHVLQAFGGPGRTALSFAPTYSMYPEYARNTHTRWVVGDRGPDFALDPDYARELIARVQPAVILLASPNNPTGTALPPDTLAAICEAALAVRVPGTGTTPGTCEQTLGVRIGSDARRVAGGGGTPDIDERTPDLRMDPDTDGALGGIDGMPESGAPAVVVVDEAYAEFRRPGTPSALAMLERYPNLVVSRTMSKAFALAGARVGYLAAAPELIEALQIVRLPYHLSALTQAVARAALAHAPALLAQVDAIREERDETVAWLRSVRRRSLTYHDAPAGRGAPSPGSVGSDSRAKPFLRWEWSDPVFVVADSDANFVLFGRFADRHRVWQGLLDRGVLIRETGPDGWLRVSIGTPDEMRAFQTALLTVV